jgi:hypothetical protein
MKAIILFCLVWACAGLGGCSSFRPRQARPIYIPCKVSKEEFVKTTAQLLTANGYTIAEADGATGRVQGNHVPVYTNLGENVQVNGPYLLDARYARDTIVVNVYMIIKNSDKSVNINRTLDETSTLTKESDRKYFVPILEGLRKACN